MAAKNAKNSEFLARVKKAMNAVIYTKTRRKLNEEGIAAALAYLGQFFREEAREDRLQQFLVGEDRFFDVRLGWESNPNIVRAKDAESAALRLLESRGHEGIEFAAVSRSGKQVRFSFPNGTAACCYTTEVEVI